MERTDAPPSPLPPPFSFPLISEEQEDQEESGGAMASPTIAPHRFNPIKNSSTTRYFAVI